MTEWEHVAHHKGINVLGSWFDATTGKPLPSVLTFAMDQRHARYMKKFLDLEPGEIVEDRRFRRWLHRDFKQNFLTKTSRGLYVFDPAKTKVAIKQEHVR